MRAIITSDWHLRADVPLCRTETSEEWMNHQRQVIRFIVEKADELNADIYVVGDVFHRPVTHPKVINMLLACLEGLVNVNFYTIAGQHDLPYHNIKYVGDSTYGVFLTDHNYFSLDLQSNCFHFGKPIKNSLEYNAEYRHVFIHTLCWPSKKVKPTSAGGYTPEELLDIFKDTEYIFTGDYHHSFIYNQGERYVVNPGCISVQASDMIDYQPSVFFVDTVDCIIEKIDLPKFEGYITNEYTETSKERDKRISAFIEILKKKGNITLSFKNNLKNHIRKNSKEIPQGTHDVLNILLEAVYESYKVK